MVENQKKSNILKNIFQYTGNYIEPFFGGSLLYFHLEPKYAIINDLNPKSDRIIICTFKIIKFYKRNAKIPFFIIQNVNQG